MKNYYYELTYPEEKPPITVRELLKQLLIPRKWQHFLRIEENIKINQVYRSFNELVLPGDQISLLLTHVESQQQAYPASGHLPKILYEDQDVLVIDKPAGQKTHPNLFETNTALNDCATYLQHPPYIVHRLDMLTQGCLLVAKNPAVVPILTRELARKDLQRFYLAKVDVNRSLPQQGTIKLPIGQDPTDQRKRMVRPDGQMAITHFKVQSYAQPQNTAILKLNLETGRTHQIRVHLAHSGWPIVGDPLYNPNFRSDQLLCLTAYALNFQRPFTFQTQLVTRTKKSPS
ncbi:MAG: RluA family pseudouridine synthase [Lactobacillus sp.]|jgi:23S rRNA pseudouridine1911/1915/1917 synthase|nr:RluA family pseudouridine synthase [Lactobacillus sp.]MCH3906023.1 RluA family pseudouridine synthase [Lactobacillus sp.]MCH3990403.1 RluA family pseudouridine synthase [Lactobacillus sp.]MCH4068882.1 RluA family pseudouridine synthase [Lactobacillus sp.]MCI1303284.1 RluA family pseudouridine synthase [Lactobacillus sp.]